VHENPPYLRWSRTQRFALSGYGRTLVAAYRSRITAVQRADHGGFESARKAWAEQYELTPDDGMYLAEIESKPITLAELGSALEVCSQSRDDISRCIKRLVGAGVVVAI